MNRKGKSTLKVVVEKLKFFNYSNRTIQIYSFYIKQFLESCDKSCKHLNSDDFQAYIDSYQFTSISQQNQIISAIKLLYVKVLNKKYNKVSFKRPRREKYLPRIINNKLIISKLLQIENLKHKAILTICYSAGLRVSEVTNLKIEDIDSVRMLIRINNSKGKKDRFVPLSESVLSLLRIYYKAYRPNVFLFNGQNKLKYSISSCQKIFKKYIDDKSHIHILRHSCFTHLIENGTNLRVIQKIAGHKSVKTTEIYTHVSNTVLSTVQLPV